MKSNPGVHECCLFKGKLCCHKGQCSVAIKENCVAIKERKNILKKSHISKHIALLKGMFYLKNTAYCAATLAFLEGKLLL